MSVTPHTNRRSCTVAIWLKWQKRNLTEISLFNHLHVFEGCQHVFTSHASLYLDVHYQSEVGTHLLI